MGSYRGGKMLLLFLFISPDGSFPYPAPVSNSLSAPNPVRVGGSRGFSSTNLRILTLRAFLI